MDHPRNSSFPGAFLGLQGIPGLLPGPSGMHGADNFGKNNFTFRTFKLKKLYIYILHLFLDLRGLQNENF